MIVFDGHVNLSENGTWFNTDFDASYSCVVDVLDACQIQRAVLVAMPGASTNKVFERSEIDRDRFWCFGNIDFDHIDYSMDQVCDLRLDGVEVHPRFQSLGLGSLMELRLLEKLEKSNVALMVCGWQQSSKIPIESLDPLLIDKIAKQHPELRIIVAHLGGHKFWDAFTVARSNPNVYLDCSYFCDFFKGTSLFADFFAALNLIDKKIIYGSDFPEVNPRDYLQTFLEQTNTLPSDKLDNVLFRNLEQLLERGRK